MLKHEEHTETQTQPAAQVRVTPEELAQALSRIEARKDAGQRNVDGTISIGEAVQQLGVDTTPEEVLAEVQAIRQEPMRTTKRQPSMGQRIALCYGVGSIVLGLGVCGNTLAIIRNHRATKPAGVSATAPLASNTPKPIILNPNLLVKDASGKLVMLSEVADGKPVKCFFSDTTPPQFLPFTLDDNPDWAWTLVKYEGKVYIRGWIPRISAKALITVGTDMSSDVKYTPQNPVPITLAIDGFRAPAGTGDGTVFHAVDIRLDKYAREKWQP